MGGAYSFLIVIGGTFASCSTSTLDSTDPSHGPVDTGPRSTGTDPQGSPPAAPTLSLSLGHKRFRFAWGPVGGATSYGLREVAAPGAIPVEIVQLPGDASSHDLDVALFEVWQATYVLWACNDVGCTPSLPVAVPADLTPAIPYLKPDDPRPGAWFGGAVALSGDGQVLAVGARRAPGVGDQGEPLEHAGAAYLFVQDGADRWVQLARVQPDVPEAYAAFGAAVALDDAGQTLVVGSPDLGPQRQGGAYVFVRTGDAWVQTARLRAGEPGDVDLFGSAVVVSADGSTLVVSAPFDDGVGDGTPDRGAISVFSWDGHAWGTPIQLTAADAGVGDQLGASLAVSADGAAIVAGTPGDDGDADAAIDSGAAYVFARVGDGWGVPDRLRPTRSDADDQFGHSVALSADGRRIAVGAPHEDSASRGPGGDPDDDTAPNSGAIYVFDTDEGGRSQVAYLKASKAAAADGFGTAVALSADGALLAGGAPDESGASSGLGGDPASDAARRSGAAYVFEEATGEWSEIAYVKASHPEQGDAFGRALALDRAARALAVGSLLEDGAQGGPDADPASNGAQDAGAAYLY